MAVQDFGEFDLDIRLMSDPTAGPGTDMPGQRPPETKPETRCICETLDDDTCETCPGHATCAGTCPGHHTCQTCPPTGCGDTCIGTCQGDDTCDTCVDTCPGSGTCDTCTPTGCGDTCPYTRCDLPGEVTCGDTCDTCNTCSPYGCTADTCPPCDYEQRRGGR
jgi:hypothetical protein